MMYMELKIQIINWLVEHEHEWQREIMCHRAFKPYIYDAEGHYLIGGEAVSEFIEQADKLLYEGRAA